MMPGHLENPKGFCYEHAAITVRIERNEEDIKTLWKSIDRLRNWIMTSAVASILALVGIIGQIVFKKIGLF